MTKYFKDVRTARQRKDLESGKNYDCNKYSGFLLL